MPEDFLFKESAELFRQPEITDPTTIKVKSPLLPIIVLSLISQFDLADTVQLEWKDPDEEGLLKFLVEEKGFNQDRVLSGIKKLKEAKGKSSQTRLESYFGAAVHIKRKKEEDDKKGGNKKGKAAAPAKGAATKGGFKNLKK